MNVFIIGARGYTKKYGGWETFIHNLIINWKNNSTNFYVYEIVDSKSQEGFFRIESVNIIRLFIDQKGYKRMVFFDYYSLKHANNYIKNMGLKDTIIFSLGPRIGPIFALKRRSMKKNKSIIIENPAGLEWKRGKWNLLVKIYIFISAILMAKSSDYLVCDSRAMIDIYNKLPFTKKVKKTYISYGAYTDMNYIPEKSDKVFEYFEKHQLFENKYYLVIGRLIPENNYETIIKGYLRANTENKLLIISDLLNDKYLNDLKKQTEYNKNTNIIFAGPEYDIELIRYLRYYASAYIHGHSVGGTNPGLLEALSISKVNILNDVVFNREVGEESCLYFNGYESLAEVIIASEKLTDEKRELMMKLCRQRIMNNYSWNKIVDEYDSLFNKFY